MYDFLLMMGAFLVGAPSAVLFGVLAVGFAAELATIDREAKYGRNRGAA